MFKKISLAIVITIIAALFAVSATTQAAGPTPTVTVSPTVTPTNSPTPTATPTRFTDRFFLGTTTPQPTSGCRQDQWNEGYHIFVLVDGPDDTVVLTECSVSTDEYVAVGATYVNSFHFEEHIRVLAIVIDGVSYELSPEAWDYFPIPLKAGSHHVIVAVQRDCSVGESCPVAIVQEDISLR